MSQHLARLMDLSQVVLQRLTLAAVVVLATAGMLWSAAAAAGLAPWLSLGVGLGGARVDAGLPIQLGLTALVIGLCFFVPSSTRVLALESAHRDFRVTMWDVARAYQAAHAADRDRAFELRSEFDSVRDRLIWLRSHPDLARLEPEVLELAAQMSHESRELAEVYSTERVERARQFLRQRTEEAAAMQEHVQSAHAACRELKRWLESVEAEEGVVRSQVARLRAELTDILPVLDLQPAAPYRTAEVHEFRGIPAE
jgi:hypothetical protein